MSDAPAARLIYVMDPMCSWCWGFLPVLEALSQQAWARGVATHWVMGGLRQERMPMTEAARERILGHWRQVEQRTGQPFDFDRGLPVGLVYDTEAACRALVTARQLDAPRVPALARAIAEAFYLRGEDTTQAALLGRLAQQCGLAPTAFANAFDSAALQEATADDLRWARNLGIAGFPTLLAERDGQLALLTNGYQPLHDLSQLLGRWLDQGERI